LHDELSFDTPPAISIDGRLIIISDHHFKPKLTTQGYFTRTRSWMLAWFSDSDPPQFFRQPQPQRRLVDSAGCRNLADFPKMTFERPKIKLSVSAKQKHSLDDYLKRESIIFCLPY